MGLPWEGCGPAPVEMALSPRASREAGGSGGASCGFPDKTSRVWIKPPLICLPSLEFPPSPSISM